MEGVDAVYVPLERFSQSMILDYLNTMGWMVLGLSVLPLIAYLILTPWRKPQGKRKSRDGGDFKDVA